MNFDQLEQKLATLVESAAEETFIAELLLAYGQPKASIARLKKGTGNLSTKRGELIWKKKLFFKVERKNDLHAVIDECRRSKDIAKHAPRFIIVTDMLTLLALDTKTGGTLDISLKDLPKHADFFLPWAGLEKAQVQSENPADIKAAERMGRLYDLILQDNPVKSREERHSLNVFLSRLLFCFFAEDTGIFAQNQFTNGIASHTEADGSDLTAYLQKVFKVLSTLGRKGLPHYLAEFPYVNGGLFQDEYKVPVFSRKSRQIIIECGSLNWKAINPDIFGSMIQAVVHDEDRSNLGMHYTSVVNIMKVIEPLFLNDLQEQLEDAGKNKKKLNAFLDRLYRLRIFDPACGSGNFLIIAYKELCKLEIKALKALHGKQTSFKYGSRIRLSQFFGIEIDDFAHETAKLSLWLAEHQMNLAFREVFGESKPTLPLQDGGNIVCGNATRLDWKEVCPPDKDAEIYIIGNPPYLGARNQSAEQKEDMASVTGHLEGFNNLDYIACWFVKAAEFTSIAVATFAFVSTNSIVQGAQVSIVWPSILNNLEIGFAHQSFKWVNSAKNNAGVTCVIIGIRHKTAAPKFIYAESIKRKAANISPYLQSTSTVFVEGRRNCLSALPPICFGSMANDGGNLLLQQSEYEELISQHLSAKKFIRRIVGSEEFINGIQRYCLWIEDKQLKDALSIPAIAERIDGVRRHRSASKRAATTALSSIPHRFGEARHQLGSSIVIPSVSSERREYIPIGFLNGECVISNLAFAVYNSSPYIFAVVSSRMHMTWVRAVAGRLKTDYRYSSALCYNTFPFPDITDAKKKELEEHTFKVLDAREQHSEKTLAELYDPDKMPAALREAHHELDIAVERCYRKTPFKDDEERLEYLFKEYEKMIEAEKKKQ